MFPRLSRFYRVLSICLFVSLVVAFINTRNNVLSTQKRVIWSRILLEKVQGITIRNEIDPLRQDALLAKNVNVTYISRLETTKRSVTFQPTNNPHDFEFVINPDYMCRHKNLTYLVYVHTAPHNQYKRQMVRQTWGSKTSLRQYNMKLVFVMGVVEDDVMMQSVHMESTQYGDILVENFQDTYRNLTYKAIAALKWISTHCPNATYVIKSDDDIFIDMPALITHLNETRVKHSAQKNVIMCNQWLRMKVIRDKKSKWYVSKEEFPEDFFPPYCSGSVFVMTSDVIPAMFNASFYTKFFWVDDFYVTGLLVKRINATQVRWNEQYMLNAKLAFSKFKEDKSRDLRFFHVHKMSQIYRMWKQLKSKTDQNLCKNKTCTSSSPSTALNDDKHR